ncbi:zinc finger, c4 type (two domains) domain-containing protein [Ditylenchus destructor]|uniref:Zinc finger, c4 type (Two domains) domain-containing protein n=1 Tax=Ditylenchus destructor TaxID=166010 RepID=A0AAD4N6B5_9BILA|nr:zinc finger, c4 type (two domains) domain-containing protein [Ditylenchus destructor]
MMSAFLAAQQQQSHANANSLLANAAKRLQSSVHNMPSPTNLGSVGSANSTGSSSGPTSVDTPGTDAGTASGPSSAGGNNNAAATPANKERPTPASAAAVAAAAVAASAGYEAAMNMIRSPCQPSPHASNPDLTTASNVPTSFPGSLNHASSLYQASSGPALSHYQTSGTGGQAAINHFPGHSSNHFEAAFAALQAAGGFYHQHGNTNSTPGNGASNNHVNQNSNSQNTVGNTSTNGFNKPSNITNPNFVGNMSQGGVLGVQAAHQSASGAHQSNPSDHSSNASSTPGFSFGDKSLPQVPKCSICGADSTGIHFGVEACAACSAFFRRTVVLNKKYGCAKDGRCDFHKDSPTGQKCRACRFRKCIDVGMDTNAVQHRRDAIGKYSSAQMVKRECTTPMNECTPSTSAQPSASPMFSPAPKSARLSSMDSYANSSSNLLPPAPVVMPSASNFDHSGQPSTSPCVLDELCEKYDELNRRRKVFYCKESIHALFDDSVDLEPSELSNFEPYITWKYGGLERKFWMMPNRIYLDFNNIDTYFDSNKKIMKDLNLDKSSAINLFLPSFMHAMDLIGEKMAHMNMTKTEMIALVGIVLFDPTNQFQIEDETKSLMMKLRNQLLKDVMNYYEGDDSIDYPEVRLGQLILLMAGVKVHAQKSRENMHLLKIFDVVATDELFDDVVGIAPSSPETDKASSKHDSVCSTFQPKSEFDMI